MTAVFISHLAQRLIHNGCRLTGRMPADGCFCFRSFAMACFPGAFTGRISKPSLPRSNTFNGPPRSNPSRRHQSSGKNRLALSRSRFMVVVFHCNIYYLKDALCQGSCGIPDISVCSIFAQSRRNVIPDIAVYAKSYLGPLTIDILPFSFVIRSVMQPAHCGAAGTTSKIPPRPASTKLPSYQGGSGHTAAPTSHRACQLIG